MAKKKIMKIFYEEKRQFLFELTHSEYVHGNTYSFISFFLSGNTLEMSSSFINLALSRVRSG